MDRDELDRLLAEYATGSLSEAEKEKLFAAALDDQDLFDQLMEEDSLREVIALPGARDRLIDSLQEETVDVPAMAAAAPVRERASREPLSMGAKLPAKPGKSPQSPQWLAWAAGLGIVFASGAISYMMFEGKGIGELAGVTITSPPKEFKPYVPPAAKPAPKARPVVVEEPPEIALERRSAAPVPPAIRTPLPSAPPPEAEVPMARRPERSDRENLPVIGRGGSDRDQDQNDLRARQQQAANAGAGAAPPPPSQQQLKFAEQPAEIARAQSAPAPKTTVADAAGPAKVAKEEAKTTAAFSVWRSRGDGVWVRVPEGEAVGKDESVSIRMTPAATGPLVLADAQRRIVVQRQARAGEELEFVVPPATLGAVAGNSVSFTISTPPVPAGMVGGGLSAKRKEAAPLQIILKLR